MFAALWAIVMPEYFLRMAFDELWESRLICSKLGVLELGRAEKRNSPDRKPTPTVRVQSLPESKDITVVFPANPSRLNPETHCTNHQDHNRNAHGASIGKIICGLWHIVCEKWSIVCETWRFVFPRELERGFYIEMGGFELVPPALAEEDSLPDGFRGRVTSRGAIALAHSNLLPEVTLELINDQSKSDILTKALVCLQAGWMIIQCIARVHQSLPLTLLEVHTLMHAICAFFIYCLWLKKPHDVMVTTKVAVDYQMVQQLERIEGYINQLPRHEGCETFRFTERALDLQRSNEAAADYRNLTKVQCLTL